MRIAARAFTLIETLFATAIGAMLLVTVAQIFATGAHLFQRGLARSDLQGAALRVLAAVQRPMQQANFVSVTVATDTDSRQVVMACRPQAGGFVAFVYDAQARQLSALLIASPADRLSAADIRQMASAAGSGAQVLARDVARFAVTPPNFPDATLRDPNITLDVVLERAGVLKTAGGGETLQEEVETTWLPRNRP